MSAKKLVLQNTAAQIAAKAVSSITTFIITLFIARTFGATGFGEFTKITAYVGFFYLLADFGLNAIFVLIASDVLLRLRIQMSSFLAIRLLLSFGLVVILLILLPFIPGSATDGFTTTTRIGVALFSVTVVAQAVLTTTNAFFQKTLAYHYHAKAVAIGSATTLVLIAVAVFGVTKNGVLPVVTVLSFGWIVMAVTAAWFVYQKIKPMSTAIDWSFARTLILRGWMLGAVLFATVVMSQSARLVLSVSRPTIEVGVFGLAAKFFEFPLTIPIFFINSAYPLLVADRKSNKIQLRARLRKAFFALLGSGILIAALLYVLAPLLAVIKPDFAPSVSLFRLLVLFIPVFFLSALVMWIFIVFDKRKNLLTLYGAAAVVHVALSLLIIPTHGATAAAFLIGATEVGILIASSAVLWVNRKILYDKS